MDQRCSRPEPAALPHQFENGPITQIMNDAPKALPKFLPRWWGYRDALSVQGGVDKVFNAGKGHERDARAFSTKVARLFSIETPMTNDGTGEPCVQSVEKKKGRLGGKPPFALQSK